MSVQAQSQFSRLPTALLTRVLQALPQRERLASCATVCSSWAAAAAAATVEVDLKVVRKTDLPAFQPWLNKHAGQLVSLKGTGSWSIDRHGTLCLPTGQLQQLSRLDLSGLELQLETLNAGSSSGSSSTSSCTAAPMLPRLQQIRLQHCGLRCGTLEQLAQLAGVTRLKLKVLTCSLKHIRHEDVEFMLQGLPNLAHVSLAFIPYPDDRSPGIPALPAASLTSLTLKHAFGFEITGADSLSRLVGLQQLKLTSAELRPVALASLSRLTRLQLSDCMAQADAVKGAAASLAAIGSLHQLQHLELKGKDDSLLHTGKPADCAALTTSIQLTHLQIHGWQNQPMPGGAVQHMFPAGRQLPQLQQLVLECSAPWYMLQYAKEGFITAADLRSIVSACPALRHLDITGVLAAGVDVSALLQLPSTCASLKLGGRGVGDEAAGVVAQLTQLTALEWSKCPALTAVGLQLLTALQALETFCMRDLDSFCSCVVPTEVFDTYGRSHVLKLTAGDKVRQWKPVRPPTHSSAC
jgi:hypothetical protein